jgi:hypothetical protein
LKRPLELRAAPRSWRLVLKTAYPFLVERGVGDLLVFGSQALSVYLKSPLRSKDLDLVSSQVGPEHQEALSKHLSQTQGLNVRSSTVQSRPLQRGTLKTYTTELRVDGKPFFLEIFDKILNGQDPSVLTPRVEKIHRWNLDFWVPSLNATLALRLAFRQPEGISPLNARRLESLLEENWRKIDLSEVRRIIQEWGMSSIVKSNLKPLRKTRKLELLQQEVMV